MHRSLLRDDGSHASPGDDRKEIPDRSPGGACGHARSELYAAAEGRHMGGSKKKELAIRAANGDALVDHGC